MTPQPRHPMRFLVALMFAAGGLLLLPALVMPDAFCVPFVGVMFGAACVYLVTKF